VGTISLSGSSILCLDPGIGTTGYAVYRSLPSKLSLTEYGGFSPDDTLSEFARIQLIIDDVMRVIDKYRPQVAYMEQPPYTIYSPGGRNQIIARAVSVFKTVAVCFSLFTAISRSTKTLVIPVLPSQWQLSPKQRGKRDTKEWSLSVANGIIQREHFGREWLMTSRDENIADAISLGWYSISKKIGLSSGN
jgi:hypothetical protein